MTDESSNSPVDPAAIESGQIVSITIDISGLLHSQAIQRTKRDAGSLDSVPELAAMTGIAPLIGLVSRSVDFALGFLELPHFRVLVLLTERDSMSVVEIVDAMKMPARRILKLLDSMEDAGWVSRSGPGRGVSESIAISPTGRDLVSEVTAKRQQEIDEILERMPESDRIAMAKAFSSFATAADEPPMRPRNNGSAP
jgi:DNA-binding MarR family transcriptional regulator